MKTGYSFRNAVGSIADVISRIQEIGWQVAPLADRCSTFAFVKWSKLCAKANLRPIYGVELGVVPFLGAKQPPLDYWQFYATDDISSLHELISLATSNPGREPSLTYAQALTATGVIKISGERLNLEGLRGWALDDFYFGISPATPRGLLRQIEKSGLPMFATSCNVFPRKEDMEFYRVTLGKAAGSQTYPQYILADEEWSWPKEAIANRDRAWERCRATLPKATLLKPHKPASLRALCEVGAKVKGVQLTDPVYKDRLDKELAMIALKNFEDYFYIIADMVQWAKQRMIVGPARGSSCGSLVCYLLDITAIDPIPYDLIFERFIDINRSDLPDIDLDFSDQRRHLVFEYVEQKYGEDHVARLGTVAMFQPRSALQAAGKAVRAPTWKIDKVLDVLIDRSSGDARALQQLEDTLHDTENGRALLREFPEVVIAQRMEGHPNNSSQHAAGIVLTDRPINQYVAIDMRTKSAMCDKKDAEELNLLKIDALGLTQLSIFERTLELIGKSARNGFLEGLPLDNQLAFEVLNNGHFAGIFQFNGKALQTLTQQVKITSINDIIAITALARPGTMSTGGAATWVRRRIGQEPVQYPHPLFEPYLKETFGVVVYQEQVMRIGREVGDLSWEDVTDLRKAMSKSLGREFFNRYGDRWKAAAAAKGIPTHTLEKVWDDLCAMGAWSFNKSHAVAYGMVSYYCCWLKAHYPLEFAAATLDAESDPIKQITMLKELKAEGVDYVAVDVDHSIDRWVPKRLANGSILIGPLTNVKGIGPANMREVLNARANGTPLRPALQKLLTSAKTDIDSLNPIADRIRGLYPLGLAAGAGIDTQPMAIVDCQCGVGGYVVITAVVSVVNLKDENEEINVIKRGGRRLKGPVTSLGMWLTDDTDRIYCKVDRLDFEAVGRPILENARPGKSIYALKGTIPSGFRMISVKRAKYLGEMDDSINKAMQGGRSKLAAGEQT